MQNTIIQMSKLSANYVKQYVLFFWGVAWRTFTLSILTAVFIGIGLGLLARTNGWPPTFVETSAPIVGLPVTLLVIAYVIWKQSVRLMRNQNTASI